MNGHAANGHAGTEEFDVVIIGSGISGINSAQRIQTQCGPDTTYTILEGRSDMGGTWNFFKYPGLRSDSDLHTFGFPWHPWNSNRTIADGPSIMKYMRESAESAGIDKKIRYNHMVSSAEWSTDKLRWTLQVDANGQEKTIVAKFIILGTGYYDYEEPMKTTIPGLERFQGNVIHTQFWPEDYDYTNKRIGIIGSGATAVTIMPVLAEKAAHITLVQRSPSYVMSQPGNDALGKFYRRFMPNSWAAQLDRIRFLLLPYAFFYFCRTFPNAARKILASETKRRLPKHIPMDPHFNPSYNPWEQRLCLCPDGDYYKALRKGNCDIVTGHIKSVTEKGILMESGETLQLDTIVTATGLKMKLAGGVKFTVDGKPIVVGEKFMWKGIMLQDLPNVAFVVGYTNASWTLGAEATAQLVTRLISQMKRNGYEAAVPRLENPAAMPSTPMLNLNSTYIKNALSLLPKNGSVGQWKPRSNYFLDLKEARWGDIVSDLEFFKAGQRKGEIKKVGALPSTPGVDARNAAKEIKDDEHAQLLDTGVR
jgi:cation diffusion facilitator CzcD-associated flavoprotein CzcO